MDPDDQLVARTRRGELDAFELLVERHRRSVYALAVRIVGRDEADDVAQDAFLRAFHRLDGYRGDAPFRNWLLRIARNTALHNLERRRPEPVGDDIEPAHNGTRTPAQELEISEQRARLRRKLRGLSPPHRTVLLLRDVEGLSYEEIATVTGAPVGTVKGRLNRARGELASALRHNGYDWDLPDES